MWTTTPAISRPRRPRSILVVDVPQLLCAAEINPWVSTDFPYKVNSDVPASSTRTEFWAVGMRNPWRFSIDRFTGFIWVGDVGGSYREEVNIISKGGNYGWPSAKA